MQNARVDLVGCWSSGPSTDGEGGDGPCNNDCAEPEFAGGQAFADGGQDEEECGRKSWTGAVFSVCAEVIPIVSERGCVVRLAGIYPDWIIYPDRIYLDRIYLDGLAFARLAEEVGFDLFWWFLRSGGRLPAG